MTLAPGLALAAQPDAPAPPDSKAEGAKPEASPGKVDRSGKARKGKASYYSRRFAGKEMANGEPMKPDSNVAASKTLPLGTRARVTNLESGKSEVVVIGDRGPYADGRIVDVTPKTAEKLEMKKEGVAPVEVQPLQLPGPDAGTSAVGAGKDGTSSIGGGNGKDAKNVKDSRDVKNARDDGKDSKDGKLAKRGGKGGKGGNGGGDTRAQ